MIRLIPIILLFFTFSFLFKSDPSFDQDLGRHIKLGEIILQTKQVPPINLFSYTYPNFPFINSHWLFEVFMYAGSQTIGLQTVLVLKIIILLSSVWLILSVIPKSQYLLLPVGFIFLHLLRERLDLRPEIFSFLFTSLTIYILNKFEKAKTNLIYLLPIIQLIWVNTHIYFIVGIFLQIIFLLHFLFSKQYKKFKFLLFILLPSVITCLINPSGIKGLLNPFLFNLNYGYSIVENQTMFFLEGINFRDPNFLFFKLSIIICIFSIIIAFLKRKLTIKNLGLVTFGLALGLLNVRSFPYLIFISLPAVLDNFGINNNHFFKLLFLFITFPVLLSESFLYLNGDYYKYTDSDARPKIEFKESAKPALDFVLENQLPTPIFNNFDIGSYISYRGYPKYRVFVDGRPGEYPAEFFTSIYIPMQYDFTKFKQQEKSRGFKTIIFSHTDQTPWAKTFLDSLSKEEGWKIIFVDDFMVIYIKEDVALSKKLKTINLSRLNPDLYQFNNHLSYLRIAVFLLNSQNIPQADLFIDKALNIFPDSPIANGLKYQVLTATGNYANLLQAQIYAQKSNKNIFW